jgi:type I restriction enzyme S subunit
MKAAWETRNLGDVCRVIGGGTPPKDRPEYYSGDIPWATVRDMRQEIITETECKITKQAVKTSATNIIPKGNVVIATRVGLGKICILGQDTAINQDLRGIVPNNAKFLSERFLFWWLKSIAHLIEQEGTGATVKGIKLPFVKSLQVPVPPPNEQLRIVDTLDEAFDGIATAKANTEKNLQNARAFFESHLESIFLRRRAAWKERLLRDVCDLQNGFAFKSTSYVKESNTLNIRMSNIRIGGVFDSEHNKRFLPDSFAKEFSTFLLKEGDLIIAMTDMASEPKILGVPTLVKNQNGCNFLMNQRVGKLHRFSDDLFVPYLRYFLTCRTIREFYRQKGAGGLQINISKGDILSATIPIPPLGEQKAIAGHLDTLTEEIRHFESVYKQKLAAVEELKETLLAAAFAGGL